MRTYCLELQMLFFPLLLLTFLQITFDKQWGRGGGQRKFRSLPNINSIMYTYPTHFFISLSVFFILCTLHLVFVQIDMFLLHTFLFNHNDFFSLFYLLNKPILLFQNILLSLVLGSVSLLVVHADNSFHGIPFLFIIYTILLWAHRFRGLQIYLFIGESSVSWAVKGSLSQGGFAVTLAIICRLLSSNTSFVSLSRFTWRYTWTLGPPPHLCYRLGFQFYLSDPPRPRPCPSLSLPLPLLPSPP